MGADGEADERRLWPSLKPLESDTVRHIGSSPERVPSISYSPPGSPLDGSSVNIRADVGEEGESVLRYHETNTPVAGGLLERREAVQRTVWIGALEPTVASEHAVRVVMRAAGHIEALHLTVRARKKSWALVVYRDIASARLAASPTRGPAATQGWSVAMLKPERLQGNELDTVLNARREARTSTRQRRPSLDVLEGEIADYQQKRGATAPAAPRDRTHPASPNQDLSDAAGLETDAMPTAPASPSRAMIETMTRHPSRGSLGTAGADEFSTPIKFRGSTPGSGSARAFPGLVTPGCSTLSPRISTPGTPASGGRHRTVTGETLDGMLSRYQAEGDGRDEELSRQKSELTQQYGSPKTPAMDSTSSAGRAILLCPDDDDDEPISDAEIMSTPLPANLLSYRQPAAALYRLAYRAINRLPKPLASKQKKPQKVQDEGTNDGSLELCMEFPSKELCVTMEAICRVLGLSTEFADMQELVRSGGLVHALHSLDVSRLRGNTVRKLGRALTQLLRNRHSRTVNAQKELEMLIERQKRQPSPQHALCLWLYATWITANPTETLGKQLRDVWGLCSLQHSLRHGDPRLAAAVAWAATSDLLRHLPAGELKTAFKHCTPRVWSPGQTVLRSGDTVNKISLVVAGTLQAMLTDIDASAVAKEHAALKLEVWKKRHQLSALAQYRSVAMCGRFALRAK